MTVLMGGHAHRSGPGPASRPRLLFLGLLIATLVCGSLSANWVQRGPEGGNVRAIVLHPTEPGVRYAIAGGSLYRTLDSGATWAVLGSQAMSGSTLAIDPITPDHLYAGVFGAVLKSTDGGATWTRLNSGLPNRTVMALLIDPLTPTTLYVGVDRDGVFKSTDGGATWAAVNTGLANTRIESLAIDPKIPSTLYAGTQWQAGGGLFKSTDAGATWTQMGTGLATTWVQSLAIDPVTTTTLYAGTAVGGGGGVHKSEDGGASWSGPFLSLTARVLAVDPTTTSTVYAGTFNGLFKSTNAGENWADSSSGLPNLAIDGNNRINAVAVDPAVPATIYAGLRGAGVFKSSDGASSWSKSSTGMFAAWIPAVAIDPINPSVVFAAMNGAGVFKSTDGGTTWAESTAGLTTSTFTALAIDPVTTTNIYLGSSEGSAFKSTDAGATWTPINNGLPGGSRNGFAIDPSNPNTVYVALNAGVYKSTDGGASWVATPLTQARSIAIDPVTPTTLFAGNNSDVFKTTDGGTTWNPSGGGLPSTSFTALGIDPATPTTVYLGTGNRGLYKSINGGITWAPLGTFGIVRALALAPSRPLTVYLAHGQGVSRSGNGGLSWPTEIATAGTSLAVDPTDDQRAFAGTTSNSLLEHTGGPPPPRPTSVSPTSVDPGDQVTITGSGFDAGNLSVLFRNVPGDNIQLVDDTTIMADVPLGLSGTVDIIINNDNGFGALLGQLSVRPPDIDRPPVVFPPPPITLEAQMSSYRAEDLDPLNQARATDDEGLLAGPVLVTQTVLPVGVHFVTWRAVDTALQATDELQEVTVVDTTRPDLTVPPDIVWDTTTMPVPLGTINLGQATATDNAVPNLVPTNNAPAEFYAGRTSIQWTVSDGIFTVVKTQNIQVNLVGPVDIQCMHTPLWPQPGETVTIVATAVDPSQQINLAPPDAAVVTGIDVKNVNQVEVWFEDIDFPVESVQNANTATFTTPPLPGGSFTYGCRAEQSLDSIFTGWREVTVGDPPDDEAIPVLITGPTSHRVDVVFIADADSYSGSDDPAFLNAVSSVIAVSFYQYPLYLRHQHQLNFWISQTTGTADREEPNEPCEVNPPTDWETNYAFNDTGALLHTDSFRDCAKNYIFTSRPAGRGLRVVRHEMGHSPFDLADEYCCNGGYWEQSPIPNLYRTLQSCHDDAPSYGKVDLDCYALGAKCTANPNCSSTRLLQLLDLSWIPWLLEPPLVPDVASGTINDLMHDEGDPGPADIRRIEWYFQQCLAGNC